MFKPFATLATIAAAVLVVAGGSLPVNAHGAFDSNLDGQRFEVAPDYAEFTSAAPVDVNTAKAQLRYLGGVEASPDSYFADDVPTVELTRVDGSTGASFAFDLPELAKGTYALDWEATPFGDHPNQGMKLFVVSVGSPNPDPVPPAPAGSSSEPDQIFDGELSITESNTLVYAGAAGAAVLLGAGLLVVRRRKP
jgi:LPXTG-motif cell wall-anchored protein